MQAIETHRNARADTYRKVLDSRQATRTGMWQRQGRYFANLTVADDLGRKTARMVPLNGATLDEAKADYARLQTSVPTTGCAPWGSRRPSLTTSKFTLNASQFRGKRPSSVQKETAYLKYWSKNSAMSA